MMLLNSSSDFIHKSYVRHMSCIIESMAHHYSGCALVGLCSTSLKQRFGLLRWDSG